MGKLDLGENEFNLLPIKIDSGQEIEGQKLKYLSLLLPSSQIQLHNFVPDSSPSSEQCRRMGNSGSGQSTTVPL